MLPLLQFPLTDERSWPLIGVAVLALGYVVLRPMLRRKDPLERPFAIRSLSQQRAVERQMQSLLVDLTEMARQVSAQLDTRAAKLDALIREADEKIAQLRSAGASAGTATSTGSEPPAPSLEPAVDPRHAEVYALADEGRAAPEIAECLNRPSGEIELILALRSRGTAA